MNVGPILNQSTNSGTRMQFVRGTFEITRSKKEIATKIEKQSVVAWTWRMQFISFMPIIMVSADTIRYFGIDDMIFRFFDISAQL